MRLDGLFRRNRARVLAVPCVFQWNRTGIPIFNRTLIPAFYRTRFRGEAGRFRASLGL